MERRTVQYCSLNQTTPTTVGASASNTPVSRPATVYSPTELRVDILVTAATAGTGITLTLQQSPGPDHTLVTPIWVNAKTATISSNISTDTYVTITLQTAAAADEQYLPLAEMIRVVATTPSGATITIARVTVLS